MQRLGRVLHVASSKNLILKTEKPPRINDKVVDANLKSVGTVFDVFGPVSAPYVAVKPCVEEPRQYVNRILYVFPSTKRKRKKRR
ncbi:MAG: Gar1/Naf1 family protein [Candidatus Bathyarchaeia archaeon]